MSARVLLLAVLLGVTLLAARRPEVGSSARMASPVLPVRDARFGVAFALIDDSSALQAQLGRLGAGSWYTYGLEPSVDWGPGRVILLRTGKGRPRFADAEIAEAARARPGTRWLIGNEPNVPGQDELDGAGFALEFEHYRRLLKAADPSAQIVAPNVQNLLAACRGCEGATVGAEFLDAWRAAHRRAYGEEPPIDAFGVHLYNMDWTRLPMTDAAASTREVEAVRAYLDAIPEWRGKSIWVTEMGVIWGFPGYDPYETPDGEARLRPVGSLDETAIVGYLGGVTRFLRESSARLNVERWFAFTNAPYAEPFADAPGGVALFAGTAGDAPMTAAGQEYRRQAVAGGDGAPRRD